MGFAKYSEDIQDQIDDNFYMRGRSGFEVKAFNKYEDKEQIRQVNLEEQFKEIRQRLGEIELWIKFNKKVLGYVNSFPICQHLERQLNQLTQFEDYYYNLFYDTKFSNIRENVSKEAVTHEVRFNDKIRIDLLYTIISIASNMRNNDNGEALDISDFSWDIEEYLNKQFNVNKEDIQKSLLQYIREDILKEDNITYIVCKRCQRNTYDDFSICIYCNTDIGGE